MTKQEYQKLVEENKKLKQQQQQQNQHVQKEQQQQYHQQQQQYQQQQKRKTYKMPYSKNVSENNYVLTKKNLDNKNIGMFTATTAKQRILRKKLNLTLKKNPKKKRKKTTLKNLKQV